MRINVESASAEKGDDKANEVRLSLAEVSAIQNGEKIFQRLI